MKKEVVHKVVVHNFVNLIEKTHKIDSLFIVNEAERSGRRNRNEGKWNTRRKKPFPRFTSRKMPA